MNKYLFQIWSNAQLSGLVCLIVVLYGCNKYPSKIAAGNIQVPTQRSISWNNKSGFADSIIENWASNPIPDWNKSAKVDAPRIYLAKLILNEDIKEVNEYLQHAIPKGIVGSSWALNKHGDYDFSLTILTTILFKYGDSLSKIYPETKEHLLKVLLTEEGNKFSYSAPRTLGLAPETENHVLMTEGSRYLKNRWLQMHGDQDKKYDNIGNGMEQKLLAVIATLRNSGLYEFNSLPYIGYTITALLNLEAYSSEKLRNASRDLLDFMNWTYALGSYQLKHFAPMRRRYEKAGFTSLTTDYQSVFMKTWISFSNRTEFNRNISGALPHAFMGACMPYRPADEIMKLLFDKGNGYFVKLGHGIDACPEIYTAGQHYLLSAGGANRGENSIIVARPICLFLNDDAQELEKVFHVGGPGKDFKKWNNTGVYENFACAAGPVYIPSNFKPVQTNGNWSSYSLKDSINVVVYTTDTFGLIAVIVGKPSQGLLDEIVKQNSDTGKLQELFQFQNGLKIHYDVNAKKNTWVIKSVNDSVMNRDYDQWPLIDGRIN